MNNKLVFLISLVFSLVGLVCGTSCSSSVPSQPDVALVAGDAQAVESLMARVRPTTLEGQLVAEINRFRIERGRSALVRHRGLDELAEIHSGEMEKAGEMSHAGFDIRAQRAEDDHGLVWAAENVLYCYGYAEGNLARLMVGKWIESRKHRKNLLRDNTHIGIGVFRGPGGGIWATQLSARPH